MYRCDPASDTKIEIQLVQENFDTSKPFSSKGTSNSYLIIGFDTEYQTTLTGNFLSNEVLSYQYSCEVVDKNSQKPLFQWVGIVLPKGPGVEDRLTLKEFVEISISHGVGAFPSIKIPRSIYLVAHFTRADVPAFKDFKGDLFQRSDLDLHNIRNTFVNLKPIKIGLCSTNQSEPDVDVSIAIRDTMHLAPAGAKSLEDLGSILGFEKIKLSDDPAQSKKIKSRMKDLLVSDWELFRAYAIRDAEICSRYTREIVNQYYEMTGDYKLPITLTSIGVDLLLKFWEEEGRDPLKMVGKELTEEKHFNRKKGYYFTKKKPVDLKKIHWSIDFVTECYHGGRNEQFWFGPGEESEWYDYDLQSAYPSAMSLLGIPDWESIRPISSLEELLRFKPVDYVYANVEFEFPKTIKYPCLPVRTENGILFPRRGESSTHISEILLAHSLGCKLRLIEGRAIDSVRHPKGNRVFQGFLVYCLEQRSKYEKKSLKNLFWKELANSTYGKTAQGLRDRRVYNLKDDDVVSLDPSKITNPFYASFITAFCRGTLSEIMNNLPRNRRVFSVTTDGFLTDATEQDIVKATTGKLSRYYKDARHKLTRDETIYEVKHVIRRPLGWRTRGQATLIQGSSSDFPEMKQDQLLVLAKGGIKLPDRLSKSEENLEIVRLFFGRQPRDQISMILGIGIKDMYRSGSDFLHKDFLTSLSMEFDWKRKPYALSEVSVSISGEDFGSHVAFSTTAWDDVEQFRRIRELWNEYRSADPKVLKTISDYKAFSSYVTSSLSLNDSAKKYLKKKDGDIQRLRRDLITAWRHRKAGTHELVEHCFGIEKIFPKYKLRAHEFAEIMDVHIGLPCSKMDVDNGIKIKTFLPHQVPSTDRTKNLLSEIKLHVFPHLEIDQFLSKSADWNIDPVKIL